MNTPETLSCWLHCLLNPVACVTRHCSPSGCLLLLKTLFLRLAGRVSLYVLFVCSVCLVYSVTFKLVDWETCVHVSFCGFCLCFAVLMSENLSCVLPDTDPCCPGALASSCFLLAVPSAGRTECYEKVKTSFIERCVLMSCIFSFVHAASLKLGMENEFPGGLLPCPPSSRRLHASVSACPCLSVRIFY